MDLFNDFLKRFAGDDIESIDDIEDAENAKEQIEEYNKEDIAADTDIQNNADDLKDLRNRIKNYIHYLYKLLMYKPDEAIIDRKLIDDVRDYTTTLFSDINNINKIPDITEILNQVKITSDSFFQEEEVSVYKLLKDQELYNYLLDLYTLAHIPSANFDITPYLNELKQYIRKILSLRNNTVTRQVFDATSTDEDLLQNYTIKEHKSEISDNLLKIKEYITDADYNKAVSDAQIDREAFIQKYNVHGSTQLLNAEMYHNFILKLIQLASKILDSTKTKVDSTKPKDLLADTKEKSELFYMFNDLFKSESTVQHILSDKSYTEMLQTFMHSYLGRAYNSNIMYSSEKYISDLVNKLKTDGVSKDEFTKNIKDILAMTIVTSSLDYVFTLETDLWKSNPKDATYKLTYADLLRLLKSHTDTENAISRKNFRLVLDTVYKICTKYSYALQNILAIKDAVLNVDSDIFNSYSKNDVKQFFNDIEIYINDISEFLNYVIIPKLNANKNIYDAVNEISENVKYDNEMLIEKQTLIYINNFIYTTIESLKKVVSDNFTKLAIIFGKNK